MKTMSTTLLLLCLITTQSLSQWEWVNPSPHGNANNRIAFGSNSNEYTIVGNAGIIMKTTNDGLDWSIQNSGTEVKLNDVYITGNKGMVVGNSGKILTTNDGGTTWQSVNSGTTTNLTALAFPTSNIGIITGWNGLILRTTNSGVSWNPITTQITQRLYGVSFADADSGFAVGDGGTVLKTVNGGSSWTLLTSGTVQSLYDVSYITSSVAVASGWGGTIIRTTDGGSNWNSIGFTTYIRYGVSFTDSDHGVVVGDVNSIVHTTDGGATWSSPTSFFLMATNFYCVRFYNSSIGVAVGEYGAIFKTSDGGITWQLITEGLLPRYQISGGVNSTNLYNVQCINSNRAVISGTYQFFFTNDGGVSWNSVDINNYPVLKDLDFVNENIGAMIGVDATLQGSTIFRTVNGGSGWSVQYNSSSVTLNSIDLSTSSHGVAVGDAGKILMTTNGGQNWIDHSVTANNLYDVSLVDSLIGYTAGRYGNILKTTDGGISWTQIHTNNFYNLYGVAFADANNGIAVGDSIRIGVSYGLILRTTNGGTTWSKQVLDSPLLLDAVNFTDNNNWYAVGASIGNQSMAGRARIFRSENAGLSWYEQSIPFRSTRGILGISAFNNNNLLAVGGGGMVLGTINGGGTTSVEEISNVDIPESFGLLQNYPNPFNPITTITYSIPTAGQVSLKIFDVLGNEIATLVNEGKTTGNYTVNFNASSLASGIYFYRLQAGSFVETKKMILLR